MFVKLEIFGKNSFKKSVDILKNTCIEYGLKKCPKITP